MQNPHDPGNCDKGKWAYLQRSSSQIIDGQSGQTDNQEREGTSLPTGVPEGQAQHSSQTGLLQEAPVLVRVKSSVGQGRTRKRLCLHWKADRSRRRQGNPDASKLAWITVRVPTCKLQLVFLKSCILGRGERSEFLSVESTDHLLTTDPGSMWIVWDIDGGYSRQSLWNTVSP